MAFERIRQWWGMKRRGEKRVAPYPQTGRVFVKKNPEPPAETSGPGNIQVKAGPKATLRMKITRADGSVEYADAPAAFVSAPNTE